MQYARNVINIKLTFLNKSSFNKIAAFFTEIKFKLSARNYTKSGTSDGYKDFQLKGIIWINYIENFHLQYPDIPTGEIKRNKNKKII